MSHSYAPGVPISEHQVQATLACHRCRGRKIKCDRALPRCGVCAKSTSSTCTYPASCQKPGPKPGVPQRRKTRKARPGSITNASNISSPAYSAVEQAMGPSRASAQYPEQGRSELIRGGREMTTFRDFPNDAREADITFGRPSISRDLRISHLLHLSHEPMQQPLSEREPATSSSNTHNGLDQMIAIFCVEFGITEQAYRWLFDAYFENITFVSLFHRPTVEAKLAAIESPLHFQALIASMFTLSARFVYCSETYGETPPSEHFLILGRKIYDEALRECADLPPPLCLLQALILLTFNQLADGIRARTWKEVGACVRIAYELQLHLIDRDGGQYGSGMQASLKEEKRRAWWAIWEFDVFASTIRRLPTAIDWSNNQTWLPIPDEHWFMGSESASCLLNSDPAKAWKILECSGNRSSKAWFIITNALMRSAHLLSSPQFYPTGQPPEHMRDPSQRLDLNLEVLANSLYCLVSAIPRELFYSGEYLAFATSGSNSGSLQLDEAKYSIHIMVQLSKFMIRHQTAFESLTRYMEVSDSHVSLGMESASTPEQSSWSHYLAAATEIVTVVRNSSQQHFRYCNPCIANTIWLAAAAQVVAKTFDPPLTDSRLADSNLELLKINLSGFAKFWGMSTVLQQKLGMLGQGVEGIKTKERRPASKMPRSDRSRVTSPAGPFGARTPSVYQSSAKRPMEHVTTWSAGGDPSRLNEDRIAQGELSLAPATDENMPPESWGWGLDELLTYGGSEYF